MKTYLSILIILLCLLVGYSFAVAGIVGSPHDLSAQDYAMPAKKEEKKNVCNFCHVPHKSKGVRLWTTEPPSLDNWGKVAPLCFSCHDGVTIVSPYVDASNTAFNPKSHGMHLMNLPQGDDVIPSTLPYTGDSERNNIECSTCHNPHDNTNRPFLQAPITQLCIKCHADRVNSGYGAENVEGTHPVNKLLKDDTGDMSPIHVVRQFKVPFPLDYPQDNGKTTPDVHWNLGGHNKDNLADSGIMYDIFESDPSESTLGGGGLGTGGLGVGGLDTGGLGTGGTGISTSGLGSTDTGLLGNTGTGTGSRISDIQGADIGGSDNEGVITCITCHAVHGREVRGPTTSKLLAKEPINVISNVFCEGCHQGQRSDGGGQPPYPNPGGTPYYHPADDDIFNGAGRIVPINEPDGWQFGKGGELLCITCHKVHGAMKNTPILRPTINSDTFCEECHNVQFSHHPTGEIVNGDNQSGKPFAKTRVIPPTVLTDFQGGYTWGKKVDGKLYCSTCHKAHNAKCPSILAVDKCGCEICLQCHSKTNPTWQDDRDHRSTHFIGDPTLSVVDKYDVEGNIEGTQAGYNEQYPPLNKDFWPESHARSVYGGDQGKDVTCCSCHTFKRGGLTAGDADQAPYVGPIVAPGYIASDLTSGLLARAGSFKEWLESDVFLETVGGDRGNMNKVSKYLCTGCHGLKPNTHPENGGEGMTHPMMDANASAFNPLDPAKLTFNKHVNCESCHTPHEADSRGGYYILRTVEPKFGSKPALRQDPYKIMNRQDIEFAPLCQKCHINY